jgi:RimJ/RimL family protein N-acetyltransferase
LSEAGDADFAELIACGSSVSPPEVLEMLARLAADIGRHISPSAWKIRADGEIVGLCTIVRRPADGVIMIGYGIAPQHQGRGHASRAIALLLDWARRDPRVQAVAAETGVGNLASQRVLEHNGFARVGERVDEADGELICWHRDTA